MSIPHHSGVGVSTAIAIKTPEHGTGSSDGRRRKVQQGLWERLFCSDCEQFFNGLDHPFFRFWTSPGRFPAVVSQPFLRVRGVDYENTRKFLLSVLWRAHVASSEALSAVELGPHADWIRNVLRSPRGQSLGNDYPIYCYILRDPDTGGIATKTVLTPVRTRTQGQWNYQMAFLGCAWEGIRVQPTATPTGVVHAESERHYRHAHSRL